MQRTDQANHVGTENAEDFGSFVSSFFVAVFHDRDHVALRLSVSGRRKPGVPDSLRREQAIDWLLQNAQEPSLCFAEASGSPLGLGGVVLLQDETTAGRRRLALPRSVMCRVAFGPPASGKAPVFASYEDALANLLTCPLRPSIAWRAEQAIEVAYLISEPYGIDYCDVHGVAVDTQGRPLVDYHNQVRNCLWNMLGADPAETSMPYFRVPMSRNPKGAAIPRVPLLWCDFKLRYQYAQLESLHPYGITDILDQAEVSEPDWTPGLGDSIDVPFDELPDDIRAMITGKGPPGKRLFQVVARMLKEGYSDECIQNSVQHGGGFRWLGKWEDGPALGERVEGFIQQFRRGKRVYAPYLAPPIELSAIPEPVPLASCAKLPADLGAMLSCYESVAGIKLADRVRDAAQFFEHMFASQPSGVLESPCGAGKSVWALCHTALRASEADRYLYVVETVDALYNAAAVLEKLTDTPVGRVHGFNVERCAALSGQTYDWRQCNPANPQSVCHKCKARTDCAFFNREAQLKRPSICLTHNGLIRALEEDAEVLQDATLLIDENLSPFGNLQVSFADLERLANFVGRDSLSRFFPCTSFAHDDELRQWALGPRTKSYARRNYVFRNQDETAALGDLCDQLRQALRSGRLAPRANSDPGECERATGTLGHLLNFFRSTAHGDATYAYREATDEDGPCVVAKRSRFSFEPQRRYRKLWLLDASAKLAPDPYPDNLPVYTCPDLPDNSSLVTLHVVRCNPTKIRQETALKLSTVPLGFGRTTRSHEKVMVALDNDSTVGDEVRQMLCDAWDAGHLESEKGRGPEILKLQRGRIKGVNTAGDCTMALLTGMATFTGIDDCALHAALHYGRTFQDTPYVFTTSGSPNWPGGKMQVPAMRTYYALRSLDEVFQAIWRTAVRNDRPVEAILALPDEYWLAALYGTVMPKLHLVSAYRDREGAEVVEVAGQSQEFKWQFEHDERMFGMRLIEMPAGQEVAKRQLASELGYTGDRAWEKNKGVIMALMEPFFEDGHNNRYLKRKADAEVVP